MSAKPEPPYSTNPFIIRAMTQSTLERGKSRSGDLHVMILGIRADADRADYFTIHNDRKRALHFDETTRSRGRDATTVDSILKILARLLEQGLRFRCRHLSTAAAQYFLHDGKLSVLAHHLRPRTPNLYKSSE
jgi:hypothetical protein